MPTIHTQSAGDVLVCHFAETRIPKESVPQISEELLALLGQLPSGKLLLNFAGVVFMPSALLDHLARLKRQYERGYLQLKLCNLSPEVRDVFKITRLDRVLAIYDTESAAFSAFGAIAEKGGFGSSEEAPADSSGDSRRQSPSSAGRQRRWRRTATWIRGHRGRIAEIAAAGHPGLRDPMAGRVQPFSLLGDDHPGWGKCREALEYLLRLGEGFAKGEVDSNDPEVDAAVQMNASGACDFEVIAPVAALDPAVGAIAYAATAAFGRLVGGEDDREVGMLAAAAADAALASTSAVPAAAAAALADYEQLLRLGLGKPGTDGTVIDPSETGPLGPLWQEDSD